MKVLYIGNYRDGTGWGNACVGNMLAMNAAGIDVVPRAISFEDTDSDYPQTIKDLEKKHSKKSENIDCDVVIQHTLPHLYSYDSRYKNIGFFATESESFTTSGWQYYANMMDEIWVPSEQNKQAAKNSGVTVPIEVVPHSLDISSYSNTDGARVQEMENSFTFGFVGEFIERKNLRALLRAFHMEFGPREPVNLFIKTSKASLEVVQKYCGHIRNGLKIRNTYKEEIVIAGMLKKQDYISVLSQVDCFVMPSRGEAFCIPGLECMALGIPSLYTDGIGMDYCIGESIDSRLEPCFGATETLPNLDTAETAWREIDIIKLAKAMRSWYNSENMKSSVRKDCLEQAKKYDHKSVGMKIKELLNDS
tara:strand:+ start:1179 stop:2267 length:1089 start_codon:yes stop_codon:yes gene_type:complete